MPRAGAPANFDRLGVSAAVVSLTDSIVCLGPLIRRNLKKPRSANAAASASIRAKTMRNAAQRHTQVSSSSARKKNKKNVE